MTAPQPSASPGGGFVGWLLIVSGALLVLLCGGCTLVMWGVGIAALGENSSANAVGSVISLFITALLLGGLPTAGGAVLIWAGWRVLRPVRKPRDAAKTFE